MFIKKLTVSYIKKTKASMPEPYFKRLSLSSFLALLPNHISLCVYIFETIRTNTNLYIPSCIYFSIPQENVHLFA